MNKPKQTEIELLPCPFCGAEAGVDQFDSAGGNGRMIWIIGCTNEDCEITFEGYARKVDAVRGWNTRADKGEVERLKTALLDRDEIVSRAAKYLRKRNFVWGVDGTPMPEILASFLIEQSQSHGFLNLQMVFLAEAMERDCEMKVKKAVAKAQLIFEESDRFCDRCGEKIK